MTEDSGAAVSDAAAGGDSGAGEDATSDAGVVEAVPLIVDGAAIDGTIDPAGEVDVFQIDATAGQFIWIQVRRNRGDMDPVAELWDPSGRIIAQNDDVIAGADRSSEIIYRIATSGIYTLRIYDWTGWSGERIPMGGPTFAYSVSARALNDASDTETIAVEVGDDLQSATPVASATGTLGLIGGSFEHEDDVDVFRFETQRELVFRVELVPTGPEGYGSTTRPLELVVTSTDGVTIEGRALLDRTTFVRPPVAPGSHLLWIAHPGGPLGANDFYVLKTRVEPFDLVPEPGEANNDAFADAAELPFRMSRPTQFLGSLPDGDQDYVAFVAPADSTVFYLGCFSAAWGSGIVGFRMELLADDASLIAAVPEVDDGALLSLSNPLAPGRYVLHLTKSGQLADNTAQFYFCEVF